MQTERVKRAFEIPGKALVVAGNGTDYNDPAVNFPTSHVLSHELGHCLGLYHTFHGLCEPGCPELVNGSNCNTCGDFVCDTPADPQKFEVNQSCQWTGATCKIPSTDANGDPYAPDEHIIMAYTLPSCMQYFTPGQGARMRAMIANSPMLQNVAVPNDLTLYNVVVTGGETKNYDVLNTLEVYDLTVNAGGDMTLRAGSRIKIGSNTRIKKGSHFIARIDTFCSVIDIQNSARAQKGKDFTKNTSLDFDIYPNPFKDKLTLTFPETDYISIQIVNLLGKEVYNYTFSERERIGTITLENLGDLPSGIYFVKVRGENFFEVRKIIKL